MRFIIQDNAPYLVSGGRAFPVEITEKKDVIIDGENGVETDKIGHLTIDEVIAKIGYTKSREDPQKESEDRPEEKRGRKKSNLS